MKFDELIKYKNRNNFFKNHAKNETGRQFPDLFLFFKKALYDAKALHEVKASGLQIVLIYFNSSQLGIQ